MFGLTYLWSWLLIGLGVFIAFRLLAAVLRPSQRQPAADDATPPGGGLRRFAAGVLGVAASGAAIYLGARTVVDLMFGS